MDKSIFQNIDTYLAETFKSDAPGAAVLIAKDGKPVFRKGYGLANLEHNIPVSPEMVFRIGSVTKQFTAVSILMLMERGLLSLNDEITRFLPDYPVQGQRITIEHLLTHTSGIASYTELAEWGPVMRTDLSLDDLIKIWKDKPMNFAPGEKWSYNNSAYVMLGAVIEKASGQTYETFLQDNIFTPLGMQHTYFDMPHKIIPGRASGYSKGPDGFINTPYLSMTQPHAAGSLASTVDDLLLWDEALYTDRLLKPETIARAHTSYCLNSGEPTKYGYGWMIDDYNGRRLVVHGGGIHGFICEALRLPAEHLYIAVLTNADSGSGSPVMAVFTMLGWMLGEPFEMPIPVDVPVEMLDRCVGKYAFSESDHRQIVREGDRLVIQGPANIRLYPISEDAFLMEGNSQKVTMVCDPAGVVTGISVSGLIGPGMLIDKVA